MLMGLDRCSRRLWVVVLILVLTSGAWAQSSKQVTDSPHAPLQQDILARWNLRQNSSRNLVEDVTGKRFQILGAVDQVAGPVGDAIEFDGYTSAIRGEPVDALYHSIDITVVCWLQLEAYPWNELPILDQQSSNQNPGSGFFSV